MNYQNWLLGCLNFIYVKLVLMLERIKDEIASDAYGWCWLSKAMHDNNLKP